MIIKKSSIGLFIILSAISLTIVAANNKTKQPIETFDIAQTIFKVKLAKGVSADDAILSIQSKAAELNLKNVGHQPLSKELNARGIKSTRLEIFQYCNPEDARKIIDFNIIYAAYMPCRIALVEDKSGAIYLMMFNLDFIINHTPLPPDILKIAKNVNSKLLKIIHAGATGDF